MKKLWSMLVSSCRFLLYGLFILTLLGVCLASLHNAADVVNQFQAGMPVTLDSINLVIKFLAYTALFFLAANLNQYVMNKMSKSTAELPPDGIDTNIKPT